MNKCILSIITIFVLSSGCFYSKSERDAIDRLMEYKGLYIGDAATIGNILSLLEWDYNGYSLMTDEEP